MNLVDRNICTGCMACKNACNVGCIDIIENEYGQVYPQIDKLKCIDCGLCQGACPEINEMVFIKPSKCYAVWSLDDASRKSSASGGAATEFYSTALSDGYYVCGVEYKDDFHVKHTLSNNYESIKKYKQSKYVYSEIDNINREIKQKLNSNEKVLFISLPCKVAGLLAYLKKPYDNLVTVDIVCHGTPSYKNLKEHIDFVSNGNASDRLFFRKDNEFIFELKNNSDLIYQKIGRTDEYLAAFLEGLNYRDNCYQCKYARPERISDITVCDFWGLGQDIPFEHPYTGSISAVLINTEKGNNFFETSKERFFVEERPVEEAIKGNAQLNNPTPKHNDIDKFKKLYLTNGFEYSVKSCISDIMSKEEKKVRKANTKNNLRKFVGIFIKKYR